MIILDYRTFEPKLLEKKLPVIFKGGSFIEVRYNKRPFYIQTPCLYTQYGISYNFNTITTSLKDIDIDHRIKEFKDMIEKIESQIIKLSPVISATHEFRKSIRHISSLHRKNDLCDYMDFKLIGDFTKNQEKRTVFFDKDAKEITHTKIDKNLFMTAIVEMAGIWISETHFGCRWIAHQIQFTDYFDFEELMILPRSEINALVYGGINSNEQNNDKPIPPPPPPPPPPLIPSQVSIIPPKSITDILAERRGKPRSSLPVEKKEVKPPSLSDIINSKQRLKKSEDILDTRKLLIKDPQDILMNELRILLKKRSGQSSPTTSE